MRPIEVIGFGIAAFILALTACAEIRPEIVWEGQTERSEDRVIHCLERSDQFGGDWTRLTGARGVYPGASRNTYVSRNEILLSFSEYRGEIDRIRIRAPRQLTAQEGEILSRCAPYPNLLAERRERSNRTE